MTQKEIIRATDDADYTDLKYRPQMTQMTQISSAKLNVLLVCSMNHWRSPTAEWADVVLVMEHRHRDILRERFGDAAI